MFDLMALFCQIVHLNNVTYATRNKMIYEKYNTFLIPLRYFRQLREHPLQRLLVLIRFRITEQNAEIFFINNQIVFVTEVKKNITVIISILYN